MWVVQVDPDTVKKFSDISDRQISGYNPITVPIERHDAMMELSTAGSVVGSLFVVPGGGSRDATLSAGPD